MQLNVLDDLAEAMKALDGKNFTSPNWQGRRLIRTDKVDSFVGSRVSLVGNYYFGPLETVKQEPM